MKRILFLIILAAPLYAQTTYYVSSSGNDANSGRSTSAPWKHLDKICNTTFRPGDVILFKRGETFYGEISKAGSGFMGTQTNPITFGAYGTGAKPILMGDCSEGSWVRDARRDSLWKKWIGWSQSMTGYEYYNGTWNLMYNNNDITAKWNTKWYLSNPDSLEHFLNLFTPSSFDACTHTNWDTLYVQTHDGNAPNVIFFRNNVISGEWLVIQDLEFRSYNSAISPFPMKNSIIRNCEFRDSRYCTIILGNQSNDNLVEYCTVHNGGYTGIYSRYSHGNVFRYDTVRNIQFEVRGISGGAEHGGFGFERDTACVMEYCYVDSCYSGSVDAFFNYKDTIRYCTINNGTHGGLYINGDSWAIHNNTINANTGIILSIGRYHTLPVGALGQCHIYNNTMVIGPSWYNVVGTGLALQSNGGDLTYGNGSKGTALFENNIVKGTSSATNLDKHTVTLGLTSINNQFYSPGRFCVGAFPNETFYTSLSDFQNATGLEAGSVWHSGSSTAAITVTPSSRSFGNVFVNATSQTSFTISGANLTPATGNITITAPAGYTVSQSSSGGFASSITCAYSSSTLSARAIYIRFSPTAVQSYSGNISCSGGSAAVKNVAVTGTGTSPTTPTITVSQASLSFGNVIIHTNSSVLSYTLTGLNLTPAADSITITPPAGFSISTANGSGYVSSKKIAYTGGTLSATTIYVRFSPTAIQNYSGGIANLGGGSSVKTVTLTGAGIPAPTPDLTINPGSLSFGDVTVNTNSSEFTYTITGINLSPAIDSLTITAPSGFMISTTGGSSYVPSKKIGYTNGILATTTIYVRFSPTIAQSYTGSITNSGGGTAAKIVAVTGTGVSAPTPTMTINPVSLSFGEVIINTSSPERAYTITGSNLLPAADSLTITAPSGFSISNTSGSGYASSKKIPYRGGTLSATTIYIKFSPTAIQNYTGNITNTGGGTAVKNVAVAGTGVALPTPILTVNTVSLSFGDIIINTISAEQKFTITGSNLSPSTDSIIITAPAGFELSTISGSNFSSSKKIAYTVGTIPTTTIYVRFSPKVMQDYTGDITCAGGEAEIKNIIATGSGINIPSPVITINPESIEFSSVRVNTVSSENIYSIQGSYLSPVNGNITITVSAAFQVSLTSGSGFTSSLNIPYTNGTLAPTTIYVRFSPSDAQKYSGNITHSGAGAREQNLTLSGTGIPVTSAALTVTPTTLSFGNVTINTISKELSYSLVGLNLVPLNDSITITAPPGFTVSTLNGSGFTSTKKIAYIGGVLQPIPKMIYVRFSPTELKQYSDSIINSGGGAGVMNVHVSGTGLTDLPAPTGTFTASTDTVQSRGDFVTLSWTSVNAASASINNGIGQVDVNGTITKSIRSTTKFNLTLTNTTGSTSYTITVYVKQRKLSSNKALYKPSVASSIELTGSEPNKANDGNEKTRWSSTYVDNQWWQVDFQNVTTIEDVSLIWDRFYASEFIISTSLDGLIFTDIATGYASGSDTTSLNFDPINTRYVRLTGIQRGTSYGISVFEFGAFESASTATSVEEIKMVPDNFCLEQNYPNPFNPTTQIGYNLSKSADVQLIVYDLLGREIVKLVDKRENAGSHTVTFNAKNLSSGIYYARLTAEGKSQLRKMVLLK